MARVRWVFLERGVSLMNSSIEVYTDMLRHKTTCWLVDNDSKFFQGHSSPFGKNRSPIMCDFLGEYGFQSVEAYESGNRSILFAFDAGWFKAKGIGIPLGVTRPIFDTGKIYTYQLYDDPGMCHKYILWGFMQKDEYKCEQYGTARARELGQKIELLGMTPFKDVYYLNVKDRSELLNKLPKIKRETLIDSFREEGVRTRAYSAYYRVPSDIRVGELFFTFMFPKITKLIDPDIIKEYVEWLGSSCGYLLRQFHESGALHGTWLGPKFTSLGLMDIHSNAYTGNYLVDEKGLTMCDFDLAKPIEKESEKEIEKWALVHVENPLYYAGSYTPKDALIHGIARKNPFREELATRFEQAVDLGYDEEPSYLETDLKRDMLGLVVRAKEFMWKLYGLPKYLTGQIDYVDHIISTKSIDAREFREAASTFGT